MPPSRPASPTVFVVDEDDELRHSLGALLTDLDFVVRTFSSPGAFHRFYQVDMRGCLLLDSMRRQSGLQLYEQLLREGKRLPVIFMTAHADVPTAVAAMKMGAIEFLEKPFDRETLLERVRKALALDAQWRERDEEFTALADRVASLTKSQRETLELIRAGETNKAIASKLFLTERAIEMRRSSIMRKLQVHSLAELIDLTATHRVLDDLRKASAADRMTN